MTDVVESWRCILSNPISIANSAWTVCGDSVAARHTMILIRELGIAFDIGKETEQKASHVFITHAHCDHTKGLPAFLLEPVGTPVVIVPKPSSNDIKQLVNSYHRSTKFNQSTVVKWRIVEASIPPDTNGSTFLQEIFKIKNIDFKIELFKCTHTIPTTGYGLIEIRSKLDDKYMGLTQQEINEAKIRGENVTKVIEVYHFCYLGDTTHHVFYNDKNCTIFNANIERYGTVFVECTFLYDTEDEIKQAKKKKHMHWNTLKPYIEAHPNIKFILSHFSARYKPRDIIDFFSKIPLTNVFPLVQDQEEYWINKIMSKIQDGSSPDLLKKFYSMCIECTPKKSNSKINLDKMAIVDTVVDDTVVDDTVVNDTVVDDTVVNDTVVDDTVVDDTVVNDTVVDDTIVDDTIVDDTIVDQKV